MTNIFEQKKVSQPGRSIDKIVQPTLEDLPNGVLAKIFSKVSLQKHKIIRAMSQHCLELDTKYLLTEFKKAVGQAAGNPSTEGNVALLVLHWATEAYLELGQASNFCQSFLAVMKNHPTDQQPFSINRRQMYNVLMEFFQSVYCNWDHGHQSHRLILNGTVFRLLGKFENSNVRWIASETFYTKFVVELTGVWLGWVPPRPIPRGLPETNYSLIVMIAELLLAHKTVMALDQLREGSCFETFMYGNSTEARGRAVPKTSFAMGLFGARDVSLYLKSCLEEPESVFSTANMPQNKFTLSYNISSMKASQKGCVASLQLLSGQVNSDEDEFENSDGETSDLNSTDMALPKIG